MIDHELRARLASQKKDELLFAQLGVLINKSLTTNNAELKKNFTQGEENSLELTKRMVQRMDMQMLLLMQIHKDLVALKGKKK
jgi:hypothetical protein